MYLQLKSKGEKRQIALKNVLCKQYSLSILINLKCLLKKKFEEKVTQHINYCTVYRVHFIDIQGTGNVVQPITSPYFRRSHISILRCIRQITVLYPLNLYGAVCQLYLHKTGRSKKRSHIFLVFHVLKWEVCMNHFCCIHKRDGYLEKKLMVLFEIWAALLNSYLCHVTPCLPEKATER